MAAPGRAHVGVTLLVVAVVGYGYGWATASIPSPNDPEAFWVANLSAPYLVIPFALAAWAGARHQVRAAAYSGVGALSGALMVAGFYQLHSVGRVEGAELDSGGIPAAYARWFSTFLLGRPGFPWLTIGIATGAAMGLLAWWWVARRAEWSASLAVGSLVAEPIARLAMGERSLPMLPGFPRDARNVAIWLAEAAVGVVGLYLVRRRYGRRS